MNTTEVLGADALLTRLNALGFALPQSASEPSAPVDARDALKAIENINDLACFASEEDTSIQAAVLLQIGQIARAAIARQAAAPAEGNA